MKTRCFLQKLLPLVLLALVWFPGRLAAQTLPSMGNTPWLGFFSGYVRRGFEFGINDRGQSQLYLIGKKTGKRVGHNRTIKIYTEVLVETTKGRFYSKRFKNNEGFSTVMKPGLNYKEVMFMAESTGDAKVEVTVKYDLNRIIMDGRVLDRGTLKGEKIYLQFKVMVPPMYGSGYNDADKKKLKGAMRKDRIRFTRAKDKKRVSLKTWESIDLADEKMTQGGVTEITVKMRGLEGNNLTFSTVGGTGVISLENKQQGKKAHLWKGYYVKWRREFTEDAEGKKEEKGISPFVIELK